jgi:manganese/zinc/iron transport system permease protein
LEGGDVASPWTTGNAAEFWTAVWRLATLSDYNSRVVILGTSLLGCAAGVVGSFTLLRRRALVGDAISHAMLPGLGMAYVLATWWGWDGKSLGWLFLGATVSGLLGAGAILLLRSVWRLSEDAAFGIVLSTFFGAGVALLGVIQNLETGHAAGLEGFIYGKAASLHWADVVIIAGAAVVALIGCALCFKELTLLCFDQPFAAAQGYPSGLLDAGLMALVVGIAITGMQAVGLILVIALLVIPAAAARFWTDRMQRQVVISAALGTGGCFGGSVASALVPNLPAGAIIILVCTSFFVISLLIGVRRGIVWRSVRRWQWQESMRRQHLLRAVFEHVEGRAEDTGPRESAAPSRSLVTSVSLDELQRMRSWPRRALERAVRQAQGEGWVACVGDQVSLSKAGWALAKKLTHQHRLWEIYLLSHADVALHQVDRLADDIEHVLEPAMIDELEHLLQGGGVEVLQSPHELREPN